MVESRLIPRRLRLALSGLAALILGAMVWETMISGTMISGTMIPGIVSPLHAEPAIVFVSRDLGPEMPAADRSSVARRASRGQLLVREENGSLRTLIDASRAGAPVSLPRDVSDPDVSWDGERIVFAGFSASARAWRIFEIGADGSGLRQVTHNTREADLTRFGDNAARLEGHDDLDPCYLPDGRIVFVSTRYPGIAPDGRSRTTNLFVVNTDGTDVHRITTERFGADTPTIDPLSGQIVYSRWWRTAQPNTGDDEPDPIPPGSPGYDGTPPPGATSATHPAAIRSIDDESFPGVNSWFLSRVNPDGTGLKMFSGVRINREATQAYRPSMTRRGEALAIFIPRTPLIADPGRRGLRRFTEGANAPFEIAGPQTFGGLGPRAPLPPDAPPELVFLLDFLVPRVPATHFISNAVELPDGQLLISASRISDADADANGREVIDDAGVPGVPNDNDADVPTDFDIFIARPPTPESFQGDLPMRPVFARTGTHELDATPLVPRAVPPVIEDRSENRLPVNVPQTVEQAFEQGGRFTFLVENIHHQPPIDVATVGAPPIGKQLSIEFWMAPQGDSTDGADAPILIRREEIPASGRVEVELPGGVPLFEVLRRPDGGIAQGRDGQIYHVAGMNFGREGEDARCVGCHAGHTFFDVPEDEDIAWSNLAPSANVSAIGTLGGLRSPFDPAAGRDRDADGIPDDGRDPDAAGNVPGDDPGDGVVPPVPGDTDSLFAPHNVVDRSTRAFGDEWVAVSGEDAELRLRWTIPVRAREVIIHAPEEGDMGLFGPRDMRINRLTVKLLRGGVVVDAHRVTRQLRLGGRVPIAIDSEIEFDSLLVEIAASDVEGFYEEEGGAAIAEVEVIGQVANENSRPLVFVRRGDATCDGAVNIADPISVLNRLFSGGPRLCCEIAADVDGSQFINMTDAVQVLNFLFRGGPPPAAPGPQDCGGVEESRLFCDSEAACP